MPSLLHYRSWQGEFHSPWWSVWPIARVAFREVLRRRLFWVLFACSMLLFLMFFFGELLMAFAEARVETTVPQVGIMNDLSRMVRFIRRIVPTNGNRDTFQNFFAFQGGIVVVTLALAGSLIIGNDFAFKSLVFYLAKPISRWHYIAGKCVAVMLIVQLMTTLPALVLYGQHVFDDWDYLLRVDYFTASGGKGPAGIVLLIDILLYGTLLSVFLSLLLVATATWMRRTMPLILVWMSTFFFLRMLANILVDGLKYSANWRLIDLWNNLTLLGQGCLGYAWDDINPKPQPEFWAAGLVLIGVTAVCLIYLNFRTRGVEIVS